MPVDAIRGISITYLADLLKVKTYVNGIMGFDVTEKEMRNSSPVNAYRLQWLFFVTLNAEMKFNL